MKNYDTMTICDFYKVSHRLMYPKGTTKVYSTWTPRASRVKGVNRVVNFGLQAFIKDKLIDLFNRDFFSKPKAEVVADYARTIRYTLGEANPETKHIEDLHDLGYLPLEIKALPEGVVVPIRVPVMTIVNTDDRFFWLTNYIETLASCELWQASTSATLAHEYRKLLEDAAYQTGGDQNFIQFQGHDFSMRGMSSLETAVSSGMGHLLSFTGTDTIPAIRGAEKLYGANIEKELVGTSIPATEHSIQCAYEDDLVYFKRIITEVHPSGPVSLVSDGYDFWDVLHRVVPALKKEILARTGSPIGLDKVVIRPDSGDPVLIVCGDPDAPEGSLQRKGAIEVLWDIFGGTLTNEDANLKSDRYKLLDSHIGLIYGDAITLSRAKEITSRLKEKGFASTNVVFGIGSYTYQYNTRDTFGYALKSTLCVINGKEKQIFKDPKTDDGIKKSQKGRVVVLKDTVEGYKFLDGFSLNDTVAGDQLTTVFKNGALTETTFSEIRARLKNA